MRWGALKVETAIAWLALLVVILMAIILGPRIDALLYQYRWKASVEAHTISLIRDVYVLDFCKAYRNAAMDPDARDLKILESCDAYEALVPENLRNVGSPDAVRRRLSNHPEE